MNQTMSSASGCNRFDKKDEELEWRDEELEHLQRLVRNLELKARGWCRRRDHKERGEGSASVGGHHGAGPINPDLIGIGIARGNMQTRIRFP